MGFCWSSQRIFAVTDHISKIGHLFSAFIVDINPYYIIISAETAFRFHNSLSSLSLPLFSFPADVLSYVASVEFTGCPHP